MKQHTMRPPTVEQLAIVHSILYISSDVRSFNTCTAAALNTVLDASAVKRFTNSLYLLEMVETFTRYTFNVRSKRQLTVE